MKLFIIFVLLFMSSQFSFADICMRWSKSEQVGAFDTEVINESSGLAVSTLFSDRVYQVNDSGDGPNLYSTSIEGSHLKKYSISNFTPQDVESLAYGKCGDEQCIYIGDIGDNDEKRQHISIVVINEKKLASVNTEPMRIITVKYPDGAHNAEAMAMHPDGSLYIITKKTDFKNRRAQPAKVYRLTQEEMFAKPSKSKELSLIGEVDVPYLNYAYNMWGRIVTAMDISTDGKKILLLTYKNFIEVNLDLSEVNEQNKINTRDWVMGADYMIYPISFLPQQEAISYLADGSIIFTSEYLRGFQTGIYKTKCL